MAEILQEVLLGVLESTRGTAITTPTHLLNVSDGMMLLPRKTFHNVSTVTGTRAEFAINTKTYEDTALNPSGTLDLRQAPFWANMYAGAGTIATPSGGTLSRTHTHVPGMSTDSAKSATFSSGDPNVQVWQSAYHMLDDYTVTFDASSDEAVSFSANTVGQPWTEISDPVVPTQTEVVPAYGIDTDLWIDTSSAIGTTAITGRLVSGEWRIVRARSRKRHARGAGAVRTFDATGIGRDHAELDLTFELYDLAQTDLFSDETDVKVRLRLNGSLIEGTLYNYYQVDIYGKLQDLAFDTFMDTNRTVTFTIMSTYNTHARSAGHDWRVVIQNSSATV